MKKNICALLIISFLIQTAGCTTMEAISTDELIEHPQGDIEITTYEFEKYYFNDGMYSVYEESINGTGYKVSNEIKEGFNGTINFSEIAQILNRQAQIMSTFLLILGIGAIVFVVLFMKAWNEAVPDIGWHK